jgi:septum formation protein
MSLNDIHADAQAAAPESGLALPPLILASGSPRRAELLQKVGWEFEKRVADIDESARDGESPLEYVKRLAAEKALAVAADVAEGLILGADTTVVIDEEIIGKPLNNEDAMRMLRKLSGRAHEVITGVALVRKAAGEIVLIVDAEHTLVKFCALSEAEIDFLVSYGEPLDKAGAYAVQAQAALFIERIEGDYWNVTGLPVQKVYEMAFGLRQD